MEEIDFSLVLREIIHSSPMIMLLGLGAIHFAKKHQKTSEEIQKSVRTIEDQLLSADLPNLKKDFSSLESAFQKHKVEDTAFHTEFKTLLKARFNA